MSVDVLATGTTDGAMAEGDVVTWQDGATGAVARCGPDITDVVVGVIDSFKGISGQFIPWNPYVADATAATALIYWVPSQIFRVQGDITALTLAQRFLNAPHVDASPTTGFGGHSQMYLAGASIAATNTLSWKIWDYLREEDQAIGDTYPIYLVLCNRSFWANQIVGPS